MHNKSLEEMHILENTLQNILLQKQAFRMELSETENALNELDFAGDDVFKIIGQLMIKTKKEVIKKELIGKKKIINLRLENLDKQENAINTQLEELRTNLIEK